MLADAYRTLVETIEDYAILILDVQGHLLTWNPGAERIKGYTAAEIIGRHFSVFYSAEDVASGKPEEELRTVRERGRIEDEGWRVRKDGSRFWANIIITALRDESGELTGFGKVTRDLSRRRRAEEQLRASEERFRLLVESIGDHAIYLLDPGGHVTTWNTGAENIKGYTSAEVLGHHFSAFFTPEAIEREDPASELAIARDQGRFEDEGWRVRKDGTRFWANVVLTRILDARGALLGFAKIIRDLTARRAAEETARELVREQAARAAVEQSDAILREERERYRALSHRLEVILEGLADAVTVRARTGALMFVNGAAARLYGFASVEAFLASTPQEILGRIDLLDAEGSPFDFANLPGTRVLAGAEEATTLIRLRERATGIESWSSVRASPVLGADGKPDLAVTIWHDVTDERRREERERYLARATSVLSTSFDHVSMLNALAELLVTGFADWCSVYLLENDNLVPVASAHVDPARGAIAREHQRRYPPDRDAGPGIWSVVRTGVSERREVISDAELASVARDEEHLEGLRKASLTSVLVVPVRVREQIIGVISLVTTEGRRRYRRGDLLLAEELGRRAGVCVENARLYAAERAAREQLEVAARRAEEASRIKDEFLATVSHELRTPLNAIVGWSFLLRERSADAEMSRGLDVIHRNAHAQAKIIEDILDVSRVVSGNLRLEPRMVDLVTTVRSAIEVVAPSAAAKQIVIDLVAPDEACLLVADAVRMQQVVWNLLSNAVKFTPAGGGVWVSLTRENAHLVLRVDDTGEGIDATFLPRVFDRFKQADGSTTRRVGGLGLGLSIVRHIVELHGGHVRAESAGLGSGATFVVELPVGAGLTIVEPLVPTGAGDPADRAAVARDLSLAGFRVLVVDDEPDARDLLEAALSEAGATVECAASAAEAMERLALFQPHVLVSDIGMPNEDGYMLMQRIRALDAPSLSDVPAIALTAYTRPDDQTRALAAGFTTHIGKPVSPDELLVVVANLARVGPSAGA